MTLPQPSLPPDSPPPSSLVDSQHDYIVSCLDFHLHPTIASHLQDLAASNLVPRIADVRCGTGVFLSTLSLPFPVHRTGFHPRGPTPTLLPPDDPTLSFIPYDVLDPSAALALLDPSLLASFDALVIRGLHLHLHPSSSSSSSSPTDAPHPAISWPVFLSRVSALLKPTGWIQWLDFDPVTARIAATRPLAPDAAVRRALNEFTDAVRARAVGNAGRIDRELAAAHLFVDGDADLYPLRPRVEFTAGLVREIGEVMGERRFGVWRAEEVGRRVEEGLREVEGAGALVWYDLWCHVGRKGVGS